MQIWLRYPNGALLDPGFVTGIGAVNNGGGQYNYTVMGPNGTVLYTSTATWPDYTSALLGAIETLVVTLT